MAWSNGVCIFFGCIPSLGHYMDARLECHEDYMIEINSATSHRHEGIGHRTRGKLSQRGLLKPIIQLPVAGLLSDLFIAPNIPSLWLAIELNEESYDN